MKKKLIITAALTAAIMAAGAVGGTIAYFSTSNETDINVTSGKINVSSVVSELKTFSLDVEQEEGKFENGGTAALSGNVITLDRMSPGDKVTFKIAVTCDNNIKIKYRVAFNKIGDLAPALEANVTGGASDWVMVNPSDTPTVVNLEGSVAMPISTGLEYSDKTGSVRILVEAVQGNMPQAVSTAAELQEAIAAIPASGGEVSLYVEDDITLTQIITIPSNSQVSLYGDGETTITNAPGASRVINFNDAENSTLTISGVDLHQGSTGDPNYERTITCGSTTNCTLNVYDAVITNDTHYPINVTASNTGLKINVEDSTLEGYCALNIWAPSTIVNIKDSTLTAINDNPYADGWNTFGAFVVNSGATNVNINLDNCVVEAVEQDEAHEYFFDIRETGCVINSTNTVFHYTRSGRTNVEIYDSIETLIDYDTHLRAFSSSSGSYTGSIYLTDVQMFDDTEALSYSLINVKYFTNTTQITDPSNLLLGPRKTALAEAIAGEEGTPVYSSTDLIVNGKHTAYLDYTI